MTTFTVHTTPEGKARPRATSRGGKPRMYTPDKTRVFEAVIAKEAQRYFNAPHTTPVRVTIHCTFPVPKSCSKAERARRLNQPHVQKPDGDNVQKAVLDALNGVAYADDRQVYDARVTKFWGEIGKLVIEVEAPMAWGG